MATVHAQVLVPKLITELSELEAVQTRWDELAVANRLPMMAPACVMAWWRQMAPPTAQPRVVVLREGERLVGIAPFYVDLARPKGRLDFRLPGIELAARLGPLAAPGRELDLADEIGQAFTSHRLQPDLVALEGTPLGSTWAGTLRERWPSRRRPISFRYNVLSSPAVALSDESFEAWLMGKSANFRSQMRRLRRQFAAAGGTMRTSTPETLGSDIDTLMRLHAARWEGRGHSNFIAMGERLPAMLNDMGQALLPQEGGRFRLQLLELTGEPVSAQLFLAAGGHVLYVNGGWDERFAKLKPAMLAILETIHDAFARGDSRVDLGVGAQPYKLRFAEDDDPVAWTILMPICARLPRTCLSIAPMLGQDAARSALKSRISNGQLDRYRALRARLR